MNIIEIMNCVVLYSACYSFLAIVYGYALYRIGRVFFSILFDAYKRVKADWKAWRNSKNQ